MSRPPLSRAAAGKLLAEAFYDETLPPKQSAEIGNRWQQAAAALLEAAGCPLAAGDEWREPLRVHYHAKGGITEVQTLDGHEVALFAGWETSPVSKQVEMLVEDHNLLLAAERRIAAALAELKSGGHGGPLVPPGLPGCLSLDRELCRGCRAAALLRGEGEP